MGRFFIRERFRWIGFNAHEFPRHCLHFVLRHQTAKFQLLLSLKPPTSSHSSRKAENILTFWNSDNLRKILYRTGGFPFFWNWFSKLVEGCSVAWLQSGCTPPREKELRKRQGAQSGLLWASEQIEKHKKKAKTRGNLLKPTKQNQNKTFENAEIWTLVSL